MGPFSPDGRYIAYSAYQEEDSSNHDIFLLPVDGRGKIPFIEHQADDWFLGWSPDGKWLLYCSDRSGTDDAWIIEVENGRPKGDPQLLKPRIGDIVPLGIAKDGAFYYSLAVRNRDPYVVDFDPQSLTITSKPRRVNKSFIGNCNDLDWSPDNKYLLYKSERQPLPMQSTSPVIVFQTLENGKERELDLKDSLDSALFPRWFPDSRSLLVLGSDRNGKTGFYRIDIQTGDPEFLFRSKTGERFMWPTLSPDGQIIYYKTVSREDNKNRILRRDLITGEEKILFSISKPAGILNPTVSPDGRKIAFGLFGTEPSNTLDILKILPADGGEPEDILKEQVLPEMTLRGRGLCWTPDGSYIIFTRGTGEKSLRNELWIIPAAGGEPKKLGINMIMIHDIRVRPDGRQMGFTAGHFIDEIWLLENFLLKK
jgi:Tol biopolymer transport system component